MFVYVCTAVWLIMCVYSIFGKTVQHLTTAMEQYVANNYDMLGLLLIIKVCPHLSSCVYACIYIICPALRSRTPSGW